MDEKEKMMRAGAANIIAPGRENNQAVVCIPDFPVYIFCLYVYFAVVHAVAVDWWLQLPACE
jgi:hypothetical protein